MPQPATRPGAALALDGGRKRAAPIAPTALRVCASVLIVSIFLVDLLSPLEGAVAVLYVVAVLMAALTDRRRDIITAALASSVLTVVAYVESHGLDHVGGQTVRAAVSLSAIGIAALLALWNQRALKTLTSQAMLLDLSHDMIFMRDGRGVIGFWNRTAEEVYGWPAQQALGQVADTLLQTRYRQPRDLIEAQLMAQGHWNGTLEQVTRSGATRVLDSRWVLQRDPGGRVLGVLETHTDVTERNAAYGALVRSERRYRRMFDGSRIGVVQQDWTALRAHLQMRGLADVAALEAYLADAPQALQKLRQLARVEEMNPAFLTLMAVETAPSRVASADDLLSSDDRTFAESLIAFVRGDAFYEGQTEVVRPDGRPVSVLFAITFPRAQDADDCVLVFVLDNTERRQAQNALLMAQAELAHAARVATLGELTASIAHEVNQPLMAVITNGEAGMRWLQREVPDLDEVAAAMARIVSEGRRASEIVKRIRAFLAKETPQQQRLAVASIIEEAERLVAHELAHARVSVHVRTAPDLPEICGDRIALQQVLVNLMINAGHAMAGQSDARQLFIQAATRQARQIEITVHDTGPGISADHLAQLFKPFFTTKQHGMGMGLAICRTTIEAHGGTLSVDSAPGRGARFAISLPAALPGGVA